MDKQYTAQEMRDYADAIAGDLGDNDHGGVEYFYDDLIPIIESLRQAADALEREKKYEYSQRRHDEKLGVDVVDMLHCSNIEGAISLHGRFNKNGTIVRREVGEWEEAPSV